MLAEATYCTGEVTVLLLAGEVTTTPFVCPEPPEEPTVMLTVLVEDPPQWSHSTTTVCCAPEPKLNEVLIWLAPLPKYANLLLTYIPMDDTPVGHVLAVALATYCTGEVTVAPFDGLLTVTVAKAGTAKEVSSRMVYRKLFMAGLPGTGLSVRTFLEMGRGLNKSRCRQEPPLRGTAGQPLGVHVANLILQVRVQSRTQMRQDLLRVAMPDRLAIEN